MSEPQKLCGRDEAINMLGLAMRRRWVHGGPGPNSPHDSSCPGAWNFDPVKSCLSRKFYGTHGGIAAEGSLAIMELEHHFYTCIKICRDGIVVPISIYRRPSPKLRGVWQSSNRSAFSTQASKWIPRGGVWQSWSRFIISTHQKGSPAGEFGNHGVGPLSFPMH